jgi:hypothetical protein
VDTLGARPLGTAWGPTGLWGLAVAERCGGPRPTAGACRGGGAMIIALVANGLSARTLSRLAGCSWLVDGMFHRGTSRGQQRRLLPRDRRADRCAASSAAGSILQRRHPAPPAGRRPAAGSRPCLSPAPARYFVRSVLDRLSRVLLAVCPGRCASATPGRKELWARPARPRPGTYWAVEMSRVSRTA